MWQSMMHKVELVVGTQNRAQVVETVSFCDVMCQAGWVWVTMIRVDFNIKVVCENFLATARC